MLEVNHIAKPFKGNTVLTDVSLQVKAGQLIHISGANGSGKSTLFKIITKLLEPDHGSVRIGKDDVIGALIENPGFLEFESMMTNLKFLANLNNRFDQSYTLQLVKQFGLNPTNRQAISKYSVGMQQKPDDQNVPKDMPSRVDTRKLLEDGVIDEDTYNANISKRTRRRSRKANRMIPSSCRKSWRTKRMTTAPISPNCLKSAAVWMKRSSRACSMRV